MHGIIRRTSTEHLDRIKHIQKDIIIHQADLLDQSSIMDVMSACKPDEIYNLAAQSFVPSSWGQPVLTCEFTALGVTRMLEAIRILNPKGVKFYQASSSEMFGKVQATPQSETTPFYPRSPYAVSKLYGHWITINYRESFGIYACSGILFNHESERRGKEFVTRKITDAVARIKLGLQDTLKLGNLEAKRDWGHAKDYVNAMYLMLQQDKPEDYVIATGTTHTVREFVYKAFHCVGLNYEDHVVVDPLLFRPAEVDILIGDSTKARTALGWNPTIDFDALVSIMVEADLLNVQKEVHSLCQR